MFDTAGYSARHTAPNRLNYGYSMMDYAALSLKNHLRYDMNQSLAHDKWDPFCQLELHDYLSKLYRDSASTPDIHPLIVSRLDSDIGYIIKVNHQLYRRLWPIAKMNYKVMKPHRVDYNFLRAMQSGVKIWRNTKFYQKHCRQVERALELFDLMERAVVYKYVLPDGCIGRVTLFNEPGFGGSCDENVWEVGPSLRYTEDETVLKRLWKDGLRVEITEGKVIMHPAEESTIDSPWYVGRVKGELERRGQGYKYEEYKNVSDPWRVGMRWLAESATEA